ncbi:hypothetical protein D3H45_10620, partial [Streptococcus pyogenes]
LAETKIEARLTRIVTLADYCGCGYGAKVTEALETYTRREGFYLLSSDEAHHVFSNLSNVLKNQ